MLWREDTGTITIDDGAGQLPSLAADYSIGATGHAGAPSNVTTSANSVTLTVPVVTGLNIGNSTIVSVTVNPITTPAMGNYTMSVSTSADTTAVTDTYSIDTATQVVPTAGNNQSAQPNAAFAAHLGARIRDASSGNVDQSGIPVTFTVVPGVTGSAATFANATGTTVANTDSSGLATSSVLTANGTPGTFTVTASASVGGTPLTAGTFTETIGAPVAPGAPIIGPATAGNASATVTWTAPTTGGVPTSVYGHLLSRRDHGDGRSRCHLGGRVRFDQRRFLHASRSRAPIPEGPARPRGLPMPSPRLPRRPLRRLPSGPPVVNGSLPGPVTGMASLPDGMGYWLTDAAGGVSAHGNAVNYGSMAGHVLNAPINHIVATPDGKGYWLVAADGGTFTFGDAGFYGSTGNLRLNAPVVDIAPTQDGKGYWLVASDGGIFSFGDAAFHGSMGGHPLNKPVVGISADYATGGYWLVASDGGIFAFGAPFFGSTGNIVLNKPVNGMTATADSGGYWFVASDGGIFSFGDAAFHGSTGNIALNAPIVGMASNNATGGYWLVASDGGIFSFGTPFYGAD